MGYSTDFDGHFDLDKPLTEAQAEYLLLFSGTRRMKRDAKITAKRPDPVRKAVGLPVGREGEYFVGEEGYSGQCDDEALFKAKERLVAGGMSWGDAHEKTQREIGILDYNGEPSTQPGLWCQWVPTEDHEGLIWNGAEKFNKYIEWLEYLIENFIEPWGLTLSGEVDWEGESAGDTGTVYVFQNRVQIRPFSPLVKLAETAE